jgi:hypothetical protein
MKGMPHLTRRELLGWTGRLALGALGVSVFPAVVHGDMREPKPFPHPEPREGITGAVVLKAEELTGASEKTLEVYEAARANAAVMDGLYCVCECADSMKHRSVLACFESKQPMGCWSCKEQVTYAERLIKQDKTLKEIREAFDKKWG